MKRTAYGRGWGLGASWLLVGLLLACSSAGEARELYRQGTPQGVPQARGDATPRGDSAPLSFEGVRRGAISFDLKRLPASKTDKSGAVPFRFLDADGKAVLLMRVFCSIEGDPSRAGIALIGSDFFRNGLALWSPFVRLDGGIRPGQTVHVDLTWDDDRREYGLFVDGRPVDARPGKYDAERKGFVRDSREVVDEGNAARGEPLVFPSKPFGYFLSRVRSIVVGERTFPISRRKPGRGPQAVYDTVVSHLTVAVDESPSDLHAATHDVKDLQGGFSPEGVTLTWTPPETPGLDQRYEVYRRAGTEGAGRFERLSAEPVRDLHYVDAAARVGETYRYSVTSVYSDLKGGALEGKYPPEVTVTAAPLSVSSVAAERPVYAGGQPIVVTLRGTKDAEASFTLEGVTSGPVAMQEVDDGVYVGQAAAPQGANLSAAKLVGTLSQGGGKATAQGAPVAVDSVAPEPPARLLASTPWGGEIALTWPASPSADVDHYVLYRAEGNRELAAGEGHATARALEWTDRAVVPGVDHRYAVAAVDRAGNRSVPSEVAAARALAGDGPRIASVSFEPFGRPHRPGEAVTIVLTGASGGRASVELGGLAAGLALAEQGRTGRYVGVYTVKPEDMGPTLARVPVVAQLADDFGTSRQGGPEFLLAGRDSLDDKTPPGLTSVAHDGWQREGFSGTLVAGDLVSVTVEGEPGGYAWFEIVGVARGLALAEKAPGTYTGAYTVRWGDQGDEAGVIAHLADAAGNESSRRADRPLRFDTRVRLRVEASDKLLPADRRSKARITVSAENANGDAVKDHELALTLSTTEEYTGVVGGGDVEGRSASQDDVDDVEVKWGGVTDRTGSITATYTAGFAAKTALLVAKDLATGDVGAGWLNTYVASTVVLELVPRGKKGTEDRAILRLEADPPKLTADGRSTSRIKVWLTDLGGSPLPNAAVSFALANQNGRLRVLRGTTDARGRAEAEYRAGTAIGTVTVTASVPSLGVTGSVAITLMSDAPAKIDLVADAARLVADSASTATLSVRVTDVHGNPNHAVPVTFALLRGGGSFSSGELLTDRNGEGSVSYRAGSQPGLVTIEARHTSRAPTDEELRRVYGTVFVPRWFPRQERDRMEVREWLVRPGEAVTQGQTLAVLATRRGEWTLAAPAKGVFVREVKHEGDPVELGETVGYVDIDPDEWKAEFAP